MGGGEDSGDPLLAMLREGRKREREDAAMRARVWAEADVAMDVGVRISPTLSAWVSAGAAIISWGQRLPATLPTAPSTTPCRTRLCAVSTQALCAEPRSNQPRTRPEVGQCSGAALLQTRTSPED